MRLPSLPPFRFGSLVVSSLALLALAGCDTPVAAPDAPTPPLSVAEAKGDNTNEKFTFTDVTLVDGDHVVENGIIEASSKDHKNDKNDVTACSYFTEDHQESLGYYASGAFASADADEVERFCIDNFENRWS